MTSYIAQRSDDPGNPLLCEDYTMQIVSVFPVAYAFKPSINKLSSYPAEISVTTFNLKNGIIQNESRFVKFDAAWFYPDADDIGHEELSRKAMGSKKFEKLQKIVLKIEEWCQKLCKNCR